MRATRTDRLPISLPLVIDHWQIGKRHHRTTASSLRYTRRGPRASRPLCNRAKVTLSLISVNHRAAPLVSEARVIGFV